MKLQEARKWPLYLMPSSLFHPWLVNPQIFWAKSLHFKQMINMTQSCHRPNNVSCLFVLSFYVFPHCLHLICYHIPLTYASYRKHVQEYTRKWRRYVGQTTRLLQELERGNPTFCAYFHIYTNCCLQVIRSDMIKIVSFVAGILCFLQADLPNSGDRQKNGPSWWSRGTEEKTCWIWAKVLEC